MPVLCTSECRASDIVAANGCAGGCSEAHARITRDSFDYEPRHLNNVFELP